MSVGTIAPAAPEGRLWPQLRGAVPALAIGLAALGLLFPVEIVRAVQVWYSSTAYGHCFFVLPLAGYLAWDRRADARGVPLRPILWPALLALPVGAAWLFAERLGIMEGRQLCAMTFVMLLALAVLGWRLAWVFSAPLLYLYFLVPFGAFLTPALQHFTARFTDVGLAVLGIPYYMDEFNIEIPEGLFYVAEACAGLRFLIAAVAFGVLYACLIYRSPWRRLGFIGASIVVPIVANGFRALGIVVLGHILGSAEAAAADHILYGWIFFSIVILMLVLAGLPFRQDTLPREPARFPPVPATPAASPILAALAVVLLAAAGPAVAMGLDRLAAASQPHVPAPPFDLAPDCVAAGEDGFSQVFTCGPFRLTATLRAFPARSNPSGLIAAQRAAAGDDRDDEAMIGSITSDKLTPRTWRLVQANRSTWIGASTLWIDGRPGSGLTARARQGWASVAGSDLAPVLVGVNIVLDHPPSRQEQQEARATLQSFLEAQHDLTGRILALARAAAK